MNQGKWSHREQEQGPSEWSHLGFVARLRAQAVGGVVQLLGDHAQELGLILIAIAVGRANVHKLEKTRAMITSTCCCKLPLQLGSKGESPPWPTMQHGLHTPSRKAS